MDMNRKNATSRTWISISLGSDITKKLVLRTYSQALATLSGTINWRVEADVKVRWSEK